MTVATSPGFSGEVTGRVYVWEIPVRLTHWVNVAAIVVLSITGYYIGSPFIALSPREGYSLYFMGTMRFIHFAAAFVFVGSLALRTYWAFVGNRWASWRALVPFLTPEGRGRMKQMLRYYLFLQREPPTTLGHNALAGFTYAWIIVLYVLQTLTGFALLGLSNPNGFWAKLTGWLFAIMSTQNVRLTHHLIMWLLIAFALHHVYSAFLVDAEEANGLLGSILGGWKFIVPESKQVEKAD